MPVPEHVRDLGHLPSDEEIRDDPRACYQAVRAKIEELSASGKDVPDDLKRVERVIQVECMAQSQGR